MNTNRNTDSVIVGGRTVPLCGEARLLAGLLAAGVAGPAPLLAALADASSAVARRHLEHLVRLGLAVLTGEDYRLAPGQHVAEPVVPDAAALTRVADWCLSCAYRAAEVLGSVALPGGEQFTADPQRPAVILCDAVAAADWYRGARPRLLAVLDQAAADGEHGRAWRLALLIAQIEIVTGPVAGWEEPFELGLGAARAAREGGATAMLMESQAKALLHQGRFDQARTVHTEALALREQDGDRLGIACSINGLGLVAYRQGNLDAARELFAHAVELASDAGSDEFEAYARLNLGAVLDERGEPEQARVLLERAASYLRDAGRDNYLADALFHLASTYRAEGDYVRALKVAEQAVGAAVRFGLPMFWAGALCELAEAYLALGERDAALAALIEAHGIRTDLGDVVRAEAIEERIGAIGLAA